MTLHQNGPWTNENGLLCSKYGGYTQAYEAAVLIDTDCYTVLKIGNEDFVKAQLQRHVAGYHDLKDHTGMDIMPNYTIIAFSAFESFSPDDICTILNYLMNCPSEEQIKELLFNNNINQVKSRISVLQRIGF